MATINFNAANSTYRQLLGNGLSYHVPPFQRDYSWTETEWDELWQDILELLKEPDQSSHYMGYLVLQSANNKQFDIIDGQQRITTISIMMLAGLAHLQALVTANLDAENNAKRMEQLRNSYIGYLDPVSLVSRAKLELNRHNNAYYQNYLIPLQTLPQRGLNASEHQLRKAFIWFKERLKTHTGNTVNSGKELAAFLDTLVDKLFFTVITVTDELNAFKVFETLNARGVRLSATDLLKNYLFSVIDSHGDHPNELTKLEERWETIVDRLGSENFPEFLRVFWNSRNKLVRKSDLFRTIKKHINNREEAFELLRNLDDSADVYAALRDPQDNLWNPEEKQAIAQLLLFGVRQPLAMLMICHKRYFENDRAAFTRIIKAIAVISFRYNVIGNLPTHDQETRYNEIAQLVANHDAFDAAEVITELKAIYPNDQEFKNAFSTKELRTSNSRNRKVVRYALFAIERQRSGQDFDFESVKYTLEHILPENPSDDWSHIDETKQNRLIYRIGNITLLEDAKNRDLGNCGYSAKREVYAASDFAITRAIAENYASWDEQKIEARQKKLAEYAASIWKI